MTKIERKPDVCARERYDVIVIGGGIYGACMLLEASRRELKALLIERDDFGGATSWNSLRIIHGGLRYLQHADLPRFRRSVAEQAWWLQSFPELVEPMSCLMPLYDCGLRRRSVMKWALRINDYLANSVRWKVTGETSTCLDTGKILSRAATQARFPLVNKHGLEGGALWFDAKMTSPQRLLIEILRWAAEAGGNAINYMSCTDLTQHRGRVVGVKAKCGVTSREFEFEAEQVMNCAGPWARDVIGGKPTAQNEFASAFNVQIDRAPLSADAIALTPPIANPSTYFVVPHGQQMIAGTVHVAPNEPDVPTDSSVSSFLGELNLAAPGFECTSEDVVRVFAGRMPPAATGSRWPSKSPKIEHHARTGGPAGLTSVQGVKYTTARFIAERTLREVFSAKNKPFPGYADISRPSPGSRPCLSSGDLPMVHDLQTWVTDESVVHIDDLLLRRCDLNLTTNEHLLLRKQLMELAKWDASSLPDELARL